MKEKIKKFIENIFTSVNESEESNSLKEEMLSGAYDKYDDLVKEGKSPEEAFRKIVESMGDVDELVDLINEETKDSVNVISDENNEKSKSASIKMDKLQMSDPKKRSGNNKSEEEFDEEDEFYDEEDNESGSEKSSNSDISEKITNFINNFFNKKMNKVSEKFNRRFENFDVKLKEQFNRKYGGDESEATYTDAGEKFMEDMDNDKSKYSDKMDKKFGKDLGKEIAGDLSREIERKFTDIFGFGDVKKYDNETYEEEDEFQGNAVIDDEITSIKVDVNSGSFELIPTKEEKASCEIEGAGDTVEVKVTDGVLNIKLKEKNSRNFRNMFKETDIRVEIPKPMMAKMNFLEVRGKSLDVTVEELKAERIEIKTASGDTELKNIIADKGLFRSASGDFDLEKVAVKEMELIGTSSDVEIEMMVCQNFTHHTVSGDFTARGFHSSGAKIESTSGDINIYDGEFNEFKYESISGDFDFTGKVKSMTAASVSGDISIDIREMPMFLKLNNVSGDIDIDSHGLIKEADYRTMSGYSEVTSTRNASCPVKVETISGDLNIR